MSETAELKNRVEDAIQRLTATHEQRRQSNQSLSEVLASLEAKYNARADELAQSRARIRELSESNDLLTVLLERIVGIIEMHADGDGDDAIRRAADMAKEIVESWGGDPAADAPDTETRAPKPPVAPAAKARTAAAIPEMRFEDVAAEDLSAELVREDSEQARAAGDAAEIEDIAEDREAAASQDIIDLDQTAEFAGADDIAEIDSAPVEAEEAAVAEAEATAPIFDEVEVVEKAVTDTDAEEIDLDSPAPEVEAVEIDVPATATAADSARARPPTPREKTHDDIRAMLDRLERAAARAQAFSEPLPKGKPAPSRSKERAG